MKAARLGVNSDGLEKSMESEAEEDQVVQETTAVLLSRGAEATFHTRESSPGSESSDSDFDADDAGTITIFTCA